VIDILIPTLGRAEVLPGLVTNIFEATEQGAFHVLFVLDQDDTESHEAVRGILREHGDTAVGHVVCDGSYPAKTNYGARYSFGELVLPTADDVRFEEGWLEAVAAAFEEPAVQVVGTDDLSPATADRTHATMPIVRRSYVEDPGAAFEEPGTIFHPGYMHNYSETELWQLAEHRGVTAWADGAVIEHLHPDWGKRGLDATDERGNRRGWEHDEGLFRARHKQWSRS
jgi:hypothetical protein